MPSPADAGAAHVADGNPSPRHSWPWRPRRPVEETADHDLRTTAGHTALLATAAAAFLVVMAVVVLTAWVYITAPGVTDIQRFREIDPRFEVRDKLIWLIALLGAIVVGLLLAWSKRPARQLLESRVVLILTVTGMVGVAFSAAWVDPQFGLGPLNLILAVVVAPLLVLALGPGSSGAMRLLWPPVVVLGTALYLPALWQTPRGMYDAYHAARNIDELLGPVSGSLPLSDYVPQYGGLLGLVLVPFRPLVEGELEWSIMTYLSLLSVMTVGALCAAAAMMLPPGRRALAPLLVVPVLLMKPSQPDVLLPAGVQRLFQSIPERSLLPAVLALVLLLAVSRPSSRRRWVWVGVVASAAALNNFESGVPATVSAVLVVIALRSGWRAFAYATAGWFGFALAYVAMLLAAGGPVRLEYLVAFSLEFAGGFAQLPMPPYGPHVLVLFVLVAGVASSIPVLVRRRSASMTVPAVGGFFFSSWGLLMFPYYVGRSSSLGQLQFFLIPASVVAVWLLVAGVAALQARAPGHRMAYAALLCCLPAALFATTVIKAPTPEMNYKRLTAGFDPAGEIRTTASIRQRVSPLVSEERARTIRDVAAAARQPAGVFFTSGNVVSLRTGLPNASILAVPEELMAQRPWVSDPRDTGNATFRRIQCEALQESELNSVIAEALVAPGLDACTGFTRGQTDRGMVVFTRDAG